MEHLSSLRYHVETRTGFSTFGVHFLGAGQLSSAAVRGGFVGRGFCLDDSTKRGPKRTYSGICMWSLVELGSMLGSHGGSGKTADLTWITNMDHGN